MTLSIAQLQIIARDTTNQTTRAMAVEILERRAADLNGEEREAIRLLRRHMPMWFREDSDERGTYENRARAVLDRLLKESP